MNAALASIRPSDGSCGLSSEAHGNASEYLYIYIGPTHLHIVTYYFNLISQRNNHIHFDIYTPPFPSSRKDHNHVHRNPPPPCRRLHRPSPSARLRKRHNLRPNRRRLRQPPQRHLPRSRLRRRPGDLQELRGLEQCVLDRRVE